MTNPLADIERFAVHTADGVGLRAELLEAAPDAGPARALAVICHPHPLHGGNMHNHVVSGLFTGLPSVGVATLRFNFRGTSGSEGRHGGGVSERLDVEAAVEAALGRMDPAGGDGEPQRSGSTPPVLLIGYSFGALVALSVDHGAVAAWLAVAPPLAMVDPDDLVAGRDPRPTVIAAGSADDFTTAAEAEQLTADWTATTVVALPGEDHFLATASDRLRAVAEDVLGGLNGN